MSSLLLLSPFIRATGNTSTIARLKTHFEKHKFTVNFCSVAQLDELNNVSCNVEKINQIVQSTKSCGVLILHAVKVGCFTLCSCGRNCKLAINYGIVFGGTDINEDIKDPGKCSLVEKCVQSSSFAIAFTDDMRQIALNLCPEASVSVQPQALDYDLFSYIPRSRPPTVDFNDNCSVARQPFVFILPCQVRPVKDPLYVIDKFLEWSYSEDCKCDVRILILGSIFDQSYGEKVILKIDKLIEKHKSSVSIKSNLKQENGECPILSWMYNRGGAKVLLHSSLSREEFHDFMKQGLFCGLLNTSQSEGMASSILEAMSLEIPVIVRSIPSNISLVEDGVNGLIFSNPEEFVSKVKRFISDPKLQRSIARNAKQYVTQNHDPFKEADFYVSLVQKHFVPDCKN